MAFKKACTDKLHFFPSNNMMKSSSPDITNITKYPVNSVKHQQYFYYFRLAQPYGLITGWRYNVRMYSTMTTAALKRRFLPIL